MEMDTGMMIVVAGVIIMPVIIMRIAREWKKIKDLKSEAAAGGAAADSSAEDK